MKFQPCEEMQKLRDFLDCYNFYWKDDSDEYICRTKFSLNGKEWSVINGRGTYGGVTFTGCKNLGKLEVMSADFVDFMCDGNPCDTVIGWIDADTIIGYINRYFLHPQSDEMIALSGEEVKTCMAIFGELLKLDYDKLNTILGSITIQDMQLLNHRLHYEYNAKDITEGEEDA